MKHSRPKTPRGASRTILLTKAPSLRLGENFIWNERAGMRLSMTRGWKTGDFCSDHPDTPAGLWRNAAPGSLLRPQCPSLTGTPTPTPIHTPPAWYRPPGPGALAQGDPTRPAGGAGGEGRGHAGSAGRVALSSHAARASRRLAGGALPAPRGGEGGATPLPWRTAPP